MKAMLDIAYRGIEVLVGVIFTVIFMLFVIQIGLRYFVGTTWLWAPDLVRLLFVWGVFLGTAVLFHLRAHLTMDYFVAGLSPAPRRWLDIALDIAAAAFFVLLVVKGWEIADKRMRVPFDTWDFPTGYAYAAAPACGALMLVSAVERIVSAFLRPELQKDISND
ncbi:TRAP transporter small permease [Consotaella salsifontis]|uniref:TRAP transporter small permease protein n=1 Tax=Consotaella salsifontis TaxID=1365950 RepID=A0A1T4RAZ2_9HYPH|nr:TRAP transporter small permease subunit [Consotaella salsifontis]SKA13204.1 TRAP-type C4-dicarboxylate transport system, small permease component [Consotaella salsifontis]